VHHSVHKALQHGSGIGSCTWLTAGAMTALPSRLSSFLMLQLLTPMALQLVQQR
jgi:hypothetical protein